MPSNDETQVGGVSLTGYVTAEGKDLAELIQESEESTLSSVQISLSQLGLQGGPLVINSRAANADAGGTMVFQPTVPSLLVGFGDTAYDWVSSIKYSDGTQVNFSKGQRISVIGAFVKPGDSVYVTTPRAVGGHNVVVVFQPISFISQVEDGNE